MPTLIYAFKHSRKISMGKIKKPHLATTESIQLKNALGEVFVILMHHEQFIEAKWLSYITADDVIATGKAYLAYIKKHPSPRLLNDKSDVSGDWTEANSWLEFDWLPQAMDAGLRCITHVYSDDMLSLIAEHDLYRMASPLLHMENFSDREQAINWLLACEPTL